MQHLHFVNNSYFDLRAMLTFGVSVKQDESAIGYFGTGFKYAIAIILRLGGKVTVSTRSDTGEPESYVFSVMEQEIRGAAFNLVLCNGRETGFTTRLGINWQPWMAYRELRCNCIDEGGTIYESAEHQSSLLEEWQTVIAVACPEITSAHANRSSYFLLDMPLYCGTAVNIHEDSRPYTFYKGVAVMPQHQSVFSYNITQPVELTEDRTAKYSWSLTARVADAIRTCKDPDIIWKVVCSDLEYDKGLIFSGTSGVSDAFITATEAAIRSGTLKNDTARKLLQSVQAAKGDFPRKTLTPVEAMMMTKADDFLRRTVGVSVMKDFAVIPVTSLGANVMGRALDGKVYIADLAFSKGTKQVASTLLEEWVHLTHGCEDFDRAMQDWLFDRVLTMGEKLDGVPL